MEDSMGQDSNGSVAFVQAPSAPNPSASADTTVSYTATNPGADAVLLVRDYFELKAVDSGEVVHTEVREQGDVYGGQQYDAMFTIPAGRLNPGGEYSGTVWVNCDAPSGVEHVEFTFWVPPE